MMECSHYKAPDENKARPRRALCGKIQNMKFKHPLLKLLITAACWGAVVAPVAPAWA